MKKTILSILCILCITSFLPAEELEFEIHQQDYLLSTEFSTIANNKHTSTVVKSSLRIRTCYDLYDAKGKYEAEGICRILTLGAIFAWGTEIDVYDKNGAWIGAIDGQVMTGAAAKFSIYNQKGERVGIAYLDRGKSTIAIVNPFQEQIKIALFKRNFIQDTIDDWKVKIFDIEAIDMRIIKIFAAFVIDCQEYFKDDK